MNKGIVIKAAAVVLIIIIANIPAPNLGHTYEKRQNDQQLMSYGEVKTAVEHGDGILAMRKLDRQIRILQELKQQVMIKEKITNIEE